MFVWDEKKRKSNLIKHRFDFAQAHLVFDHPGKKTRHTVRNGEERYADIAFVELYEINLTLIYAKREGDIRVISLRNSSREERLDHSQLHVRN